jgi:hypothetical protein
MKESGLRMRKLRISGLAVLFMALSASTTLAAEEPVFEIELKDGLITPSRLEVPAKSRFKLIVTNKGQAPAEFESRELRKEVVVASGSKATLVIRTLDPGEYKFFDDFQPGAPAAVLIAK